MALAGAGGGVSAEAARVDRGRIARPNGWWGIAVFVATEATLFGTLIGTYYFLRFETPKWPPAGVPDPKVLVPLLLTAALVATSLPVQFAYSAARRGRLGPARLALLLAVAVQGAYLGIQIHLFSEDLDKFSPDQSAYASIHFTLLGGHHFHVLIGILLEAWLLLRLVTGLTRYRLVALQATAFYWHFVNVLAVVVVLTQVSPAL
jgi:heme/copper-type cytochrome/quinol oxidase subunit 3